MELPERFNGFLKYIRYKNNYINAPLSPSLAYTSL